MGECHFHLVALAAGLVEGLGIGQCPYVITDALIDVARDLSRWRVRTTFELQGTGDTLVGAGSIYKRVAAVDFAGGVQDLATRAGVNIAL